MYISMLYCKEESEAKIIVNQVFFKFFTKIDSFDPKRAVKPWLKRITINTAIDYIRKRKKYIYKQVDNQSTLGLAEENWGFQNLLEEDVLNIIKTLPQHYKVVFVLFAIEGYQHKEIADKLDISEATSKSTYYRARKQLIDLIEKTKLKGNERKGIISKNKG